MRIRNNKVNVFLSDDEKFILKRDSSKLNLSQSEYIRNLIVQKKFLPAGRILSNIGIDDEKCSLSNCYVITPPEYSIESIYETCSKLARTYSYGGGCGIDISNLAPEGAKVHNQAKATSGAVSFMDTFSQVTEQIG